MYNTTGRAVPFIWILLESQSTVDLIANPRMLLNIRKVRSEDAICVHCNSGSRLWTESATYLAMEMSGMN